MSTFAVVNPRSAGGQLLEDAHVGGSARRPVHEVSDAAAHRVDAAAMVEVEVGEHQKVDARDAELIEAACEGRRVGSGVDEGDAPRRAHDDPVAPQMRQQRGGHLRATRVVDAHEQDLGWAVG